MAATVQICWFGGNATEPAGVDVGGGVGFKFNREDTQAGTTTPVPIPTSGGPGAQRFSWKKNLGMKVTVAGGTLTNFTMKMDSSPTTGLREYWKANASYLQPAVGNMPADDNVSNTANPTGYTALTTSPQTWYAGPVSAGTTGRKGDFLELALGVGFDFAGGGSSNTALPNMTATYDES